MLGTLAQSSIVGVFNVSDHIDMGGRHTLALPGFIPGIADGVTISDRAARIDAGAVIEIVVTQIENILVIIEQCDDNIHIV